jgi:hypothetical protein
MAVAPGSVSIIGEIAVWTVVFYGRPRRLERLIMRRGFRHVSAFAWIGPERWIEVDPGGGRLSVRIFDYAGYVGRRVDLDAKGACEVKVKGVDNRHQGFPPMTCTQVIAALLGVKGALRPQALHRALSAVATEAFHGGRTGQHSDERRPGHDAGLARVPGDAGR